MATPQQSRSKRLVWSLLALIGLASGGLGLAHRAQARAAAELRSQALEQGLLIDAATTEAGFFSVDFRDVKLRFASAPAIRAVLDRAQLLGALSGEPRLRIDEVHFVLSGEPTTVYENIGLLPEWKGLPVSWQRFSVGYRQGELGQTALQDLRLEHKGSKYTLRARVAKVFDQASFVDAVFSVDKRNQLLELGLGEAPGQPAPAQLGYFASSSGASQWLFNARHQPMRPFARALGWELGEAFEPSRAVSSAALIVPDDRTRPKRASVEVSIDQWPKPAWPDASALLGDTLAFATYFPFPDDRVGWDLPKVSVSLALFTLKGEGRVTWGPSPNLSFHVAGRLTCAQLRGNLSPSVHLDQVRKYLDPEPKLAAAEAAARLKEEVELGFTLSADKADPAKRNATWHLAGACGLPELSDG